MPSKLSSRKEIMGVGEIGLKEGLEVCDRNRRLKKRHWTSEGRRVLRAGAKKWGDKLGRKIKQSKVL
jgi:hypothetical protein